MTLDHKWLLSQKCDNYLQIKVERYKSYVNVKHVSCSAALHRKQDKCFYWFKYDLTCFHVIATQKY